MADFEDDSGELSVEEKLQIAQHFLLSSPPGQFSEVLADVRKIVPGEAVTDSFASGVARAYNLKHSRIVTSPSGNKVMLNLAAELEPGVYQDPVSGGAFVVDHLTGVAKEAPSAAATRGEHEVLRAAVQAAVSKYVAGSFQRENGAGCVYARDGKLTICIGGERTSLKNFWSGKWTSLWTVQTGAMSLAGEVKVHVHYFEDGNLQLQTSKTATVGDVRGASDNDTAAKIVKFIQATEADLQAALEDMYVNMNDQTFKSIRRIMPVSRTKMDWNINAVRMIKQTTRK